MHKFKVTNQEYIPNKENPKKIKITVQAEVNGSTLEKTMPFSPRQVADGRWEKHFVNWKEKLEGKTLEIPDLQGEKIENDGYKETGPERNYPEREADPKEVDQQN